MQKSILYKIYATALFATLAMLLLYLFLNHHYDGSLWKTMQQSKSALTGEYCELDNTTRFFRQNMNTYSNLAYFFLGCIVIQIALYDNNKKSAVPKNRLQQYPLLSFLFGCCLVYLCFGSAFFHASLTWIGQRFDMNGAYSICIALAGISGYRLMGERTISRRFEWRYVLLLICIMAVFLEIHLLIPSTYLLPLLVISITTMTVVNYIQQKDRFNLLPAILSFILMITAFLLRTLDIKKIGCDAFSVYQGHSLWHIFTGMSAFLLYWFYRSERA